MADVKPDEKGIFCEALDRQSARERAVYLDAACGDDADLRARVEALLNAHQEAGNFLGGFPSGPASTAKSMVWRVQAVMHGLGQAAPQTEPGKGL